MKKLLLSSLVVSLLVSAAWGQSNVLSRNAVGYIRTSVPSNIFQLVRVDFVPLSGEGTIGQVIGNQLPTHSRVYLWDYSNQVYKTYMKDARHGWGDAANVVLHRGESFWVRSPQATSLYFMGEVPADTNTVAVGQGINFLGYAFPVDVAWTNTALAHSLGVGDQLFVWNTNAGGSWTVYSNSVSGWGAADSLVLHPGQGFLIQTTNTVNWTEPKPYQWP